MDSNLIRRGFYFKKIEPYIDKDLIKVIVGQRRVGKSYFLLQIIEAIKERKGAVPIISINKELHEFEDIHHHRDLLAYIEKKAKGVTSKMYVFIDEVQDIEDFEKALRSLKASGKFDIYCTGSNAQLLSGELATYLSGRYVEIRVHSLSYPEFLEFHQFNDSHESLMKFIMYGGLPYLIHLGLTDELVYDYLKNVYTTILFKDVIKRFKVRNVNFLERLVDYLAENVGSLISAKKVSDFLKSQKINISPNVVLNYISHLTQAFFIAEVPRSDVKGKKVFEINEKYYFEDLGLRHSIIGYKQMDISKVLENIVFHHFYRLGYSVTIGQLGTKEIDFVCEKQGERLYVQVAYRITEENKQREFGNLDAIPDNYPKMVVSMEESPGSGTFKGIKHVNIRDLLLSATA